MKYKLYAIVVFVPLYFVTVIGKWHEYKTYITGKSSFSLKAVTAEYLSEIKELWNYSKGEQ